MFDQVPMVGRILRKVRVLFVSRASLAHGAVGTLCVPAVALWLGRTVGVLPIVALLVLGFLLAGLSFVVDCGPWPGFGVVCLVGWLGAWTFRCVLGGLFGDVL